jgi:hypothetical protein
MKCSIAIAKRASDRTLFGELQFNVGQLGFEKVLIAINIPQMGMQTGNSFVHNHPLVKCIVNV